MLIALVIFLRSFFGGAEALGVRIEEAVADPDRRRGALEAVERIEALEDRLAEQVRATSDAVRRLHLRHDATREEYLDVLGPLEEVRREAARGLLVARAELRQVLTEAEWGAVFPAS